MKLSPIPVWLHAIFVAVAPVPYKEQDLTHCLSNQLNSIQPKADTYA